MTLDMTSVSGMPLAFTQVAVRGKYLTNRERKTWIHKNDKQQMSQG